MDKRKCKSSDVGVGLLLGAARVNVSCQHFVYLLMFAVFAGNEMEAGVLECVMIYINECSYEM